MSDAVGMDKDFIVREMHADELGLAIEWAAQEGWNPGLHDARCFHAADPSGFFIGELRGEPVGTMSAIAYGEHFGFVGLYIVKPQFRGNGFGYRIWQHGMAYLGNRNIGLDGVVAQQENYRKSGFQLAYRHVRFQGVAQRSPQSTVPGTVSRLADLPFDQLEAYDRERFLAPRSPFLTAWLDQPGVVALAALRDGRLRGYGVLRKCRAGRKVGPLFADDEQIAQTLFESLLAQCPGETVALDVPEPNAAAIAMAERHGMRSVFETARMYTKEAPHVALATVFGVTSFELG